MIKVLEEKPVPRATAVCDNCGSTLEYGNADLTEIREYDAAAENVMGVLYPRTTVRYRFACPVCGCKVNADWINKSKLP